MNMVITKRVAHWVLPLALAVAAAPASAQDEEKEAWQRWYSETLKLSFLAYGKPVEEVLELRGALAELTDKAVSVAFNVEGTEFSVMRLTAKPDTKLSLPETLELRLSRARERFLDFKVVEQKEVKDSDAPFADVIVTYTGVESVLMKRRVMVIGEGSDQWLLEGMAEADAWQKDAADKFFSSVWMDKEGKLKPGDKKKG